MKIDMKKALYCLLGLTFLQDSSADVTRLKINLSKKQGNTITYEISNGSKVVTVGSIDDKYDADNKFDLYCDNDGYVYINIKGVEGETEKKRVANEQFRRIIECGLVTDVPQYSIVNGCEYVLSENCGGKLSLIKAFNPRIFETKFVEPHEKTYNVYNRNKRKIVKADDIKQKFIDHLDSFSIDNRFYMTHEDWQMPGISAYIPQKLLSSSMQAYTCEVPVYCGMKIAANGQGLTYFKIEDYKPGCVEKNFYNHEHTEKQHVINHMGGTIQKQSAKDSSNQPLQSIEGGHLMMWTEGNPCTVGSRDNGCMCCEEFYQNNPMKCESMDIYFSEVRGNQLNAQNGQNCEHCFNILNELSGGDLKTNLEEKGLYDDKNGIRKLENSELTQLTPVTDYCNQIQQNITTNLKSDKVRKKAEDAFNKCFVTDDGKTQYHVIPTQK